MLETASSSMGITAFIHMTISIVLIGVTWWALQSFKFDLFLRNINAPQAKVLQILLSIAIGHGVTRFIVDYMQWSSFLRHLF